MGDAVEEDRHAPRYDDEDRRPTSKRELAGWYSYGWAAEVFTICAMGSFLPITLEQLARDRGVRLSDKTTPCKASWAPTSFSREAVHATAEPPACIVYIGGAEINTASFAMYTFSISVLVQALLIISMSAAADHGRFRKTYLLVFAFTGAIATMLFLPIVPKVYLLGALLAVISNTCFGASFVLLNSFLPLLVRYHPTVQLAEIEAERRASYQQEDTAHGADEDLGDDVPETEPILHPGDNVDDTLLGHGPTTRNSPELRLSTTISANGVGIGYIAAVLLQSIAILVVVGTGSTTFSLRLVLFIVGLWWFVFTVPAALWLRPRPGPPIPKSIPRHWFGYTIYAWKSLWITIKRARRLKDVLLFLSAWFLLSDGIATVSGTAVLFAKTTLGMKPAALGLINVIATVAGVLGAFFWSVISRSLNLRASHTIVACICLFEVIPLYGLLGFVPAIRRFGSFGLQQPWEMYPLGAVFGFVLGGLSSYCRSFFGELIPPGFEAAFYALYAITDKGSSIFGPAIVGAIIDRYGEIRPAFVFLAVLIFLPLPLMLLVNVERGKREAAQMAVQLEGKDAPVSGPDYETIPRILLTSEDEV